jgi:hypothetical protein
MDKPIITKIEFSSEIEEEIKDILDGKPTEKMKAMWKRRGVNRTDYYKPPSLRNRIDHVKKNYYKGLCHKC